MLEEYQAALMDDDIPYERQINTLVIKFKKQVQERKNVLLRGADDGQRAKRWGRLKNLEAEIQAEAKALPQEIQGKPGAEQLQKYFTSLFEMAAGYQRGYDAFVASGHAH